MPENTLLSTGENRKHLRIPRELLRGICGTELLKSRTAPVVVIDNAAGLKMGIDGNGPHERKTALFEIPAQSGGETVTRRHRSGVMSPVADGFAARV